MSDILLLLERIKNTIHLGESHFREFKSALDGEPNQKRHRPVRNICSDIAEALVAFANADGGELIIGIEDDGHVSGIPHSEIETEQMLNAVKSHVHQGVELPILYSTKLAIDGKTILFFSVAKGTTEIYQLSDGRCVKRKDKSTIPIAVRQIQFERQEIKSREYDRQFVDGAAVADLDIPLVQSFADKYLRGLSVERYLQQVGLAEYSTNGIRLRMAAILLFARDIQKWHPRCEVRILKVIGTQLKSGEHYNVKSDETVRENILQLVLNSWERLRPFLADKTEFGPDAKFAQKYIYPEWASREALINAIAHRDYSIHNPIEIFIYDDRMEIKSPGALLSSLRIEDLEKLQGFHESRNVLIAKILRENEYMRELGEGIKRMFQLMEQNELGKPKLYSDTASFSVTLTHKSVFTVQQEQWLSLYEDLNLTPRQKKIVILGIDSREISPNDIYRAMNTNDRDTYDREVTGLRQANVLIEIRTKSQVKSYAYLNKLQKGEVGRYKVQVPQPPEVKPISEISEDFLKDPSLAIFIYNIPFSATEETVKIALEKFGSVRQVDLPIWQDTQQLKGFGFVWFYNKEAANLAIQIGTVGIDGRIVSIKKYTSMSR